MFLHVLCSMEDALGGCPNHCGLLAFGSLCCEVLVVLHSGLAGIKLQHLQLLALFC